MKSTHLLCLLACSCMTSALLPGVARAAEPTAASSPGERAADLYKRATELYRDHKLAEAQKVYLDAWALQQSYDIATNLGAVELDLKLYRDAAEHLAFAKRTFPARGKEDERTMIEKRLALAKAEVVTLRVKVNVDKADVSVNGKRAGIAPLADELFADAGAVVVYASLDGYEASKQSFEGTKGESRDVEMKLTPRAGEGEPSKVPAIIAFGVGGAGLVAGAITGALSVVKLGELKTACGGDFSCPPPRRGEADAGRTLGDLSTAGFVIAGLGAAAGATLLLIPLGKTAPSKASVTVGPGFVGVKGAF